MKTHYYKEAKAVEENCKYTAEAHHIIAARYGKLAFWFQLIPAVIASLSGILVAGSIVPAWFGLLTVISSIVTAVSGVMNPLQGYFDHLQAAKAFTVLKQDARALHATTGLTLDDVQLKYETLAIQQRYAEIVRLVPPTNDASFKEARTRVKSGLHEQDRE